MPFFQRKQDGDIDLDKEWIRLNPLYRAILVRDKAGKKQAMKEFTYIYMIYNYDSDYAHFPIDERITQACAILELDEKVVLKDEVLQAACEHYLMVQKKRLEYRLVQAAKTSIEAKINYFTEADFTERKKDGSPVLTADAHTKAIASMKQDMLNLREAESMLGELIANEGAGTRKNIEKGPTEDMDWNQNDSQYNPFLTQKKVII